MAVFLKRASCQCVWSEGRRMTSPIQLCTFASAWCPRAACGRRRPLSMWRRVSMRSRPGGEWDACRTHPPRPVRSAWGLCARSRSTVPQGLFGTARIRRASKPWQPLSGPEGPHIDDETVFDIAPDRTLIGLIDVLYRDALNVAHDVVLATEIQHLLRLRQTADQ